MLGPAQEPRPWLCRIRWGLSWMRKGSRHAARSRFPACRQQSQPPACLLWPPHRRCGLGCPRGVKAIGCMVCLRACPDECSLSLAGDRAPPRAQGLSVYQWGSAACVQRLGYGSAGFPAPGEALLTADRPNGGDIALSGHRKVRRATRCTKAARTAPCRLCVACLGAGKQLSVHAIRQIAKTCADSALLAQRLLQAMATDSRPHVVMQTTCLSMLSGIGLSDAAVGAAMCRCGCCGRSRWRSRRPSCCGQATQLRRWPLRTPPGRPGQSSPARRPPSCSYTVRSTCRWRC